MIQFWVNIIRCNLIFIKLHNKFFLIYMQNKLNLIKINFPKKLFKNFNIFLKSKGPSFFEITINAGTIENLGRPNN